MKQTTFSIEEIKNYLCFQCDLDDVYQNLSEENIIKANKTISTEDDELRIAYQSADMEDYENKRGNYAINDNDIMDARDDEDTFDASFYSKK